jgi:uncharacterized protein involved in exopolysaccharide biosynthesis
MDNSDSIIVAASKPLLRTHRDLLAIGFRHRRLIGISFAGILLGGLAVAFLQPAKYRSQMKILVKRDRAETLINAGPNSVWPFDAGITEQQINSEVQLLKSRDLLTEVVVACGLDRPRARGWASIFDRYRSRGGAATAKAAQLRVADAVQALSNALDVGMVPDSNTISVSYESTDPQLAARVLRTLESAYLKKHVSVYQSPGAFTFFQQQAKLFSQRLNDAQAELVKFNREHGVVSAPTESATELAQLATFRAALHTTQSQISATEDRIRTLERESGSTPSRVPTSIVTSKDGTLLGTLQSTLLTLELKRTDLLMKYSSSYPPVRSLDMQIAQTRSAISKAEKNNLQATTTDRDLTFQWENEELAKDKADLASLSAQAAATKATVRTYEARAQFLNQEGVAQANLTMAVQTAQANYLLYRKKEEEARINDALDRQRIVNVAIAEAPMVPSLPSSHRALTVILAGLLACVVSGGLAFGAESLDRTFRTPDEVSNLLDIPVLAALPAASGNGKERANAVTPVSP